MKIDLPECIDKPIENVLTNITDKPSKEIGEFFNDLLRVIFGGVHFIAEKQQIKYKYALEQYEKRCEENIKSIPESRRAEPDLQIIAGALQDSRFCIESEMLRLMFANLISGSLDTEKKANVHPSFSNIIKQMSTSEASLFASLEPNRAFPIVEYHLVSDQNRFQILAQNVLLAKDENADEETIYQRIVDLSLLQHLGLILISFDKALENEKYIRYINNNVYEELKKENAPLNVEIKKGIILLTPIGNELWNVCCKDTDFPKIDGVPPTFL